MRENKYFIHSELIRYAEKLIENSLDEVHPLSKLDVFMITKHEIYRAAKKAGFTNEVAWFFMQEPHALPDWVSNDKPDALIPRIDPTEDEDE
jgi:hypothetical protein